MGSRTHLICLNKYAYCHLRYPRVSYLSHSCTSVKACVSYRACVMFVQAMQKSQMLWDVSLSESRDICVAQIISSL